MEKVNREVCAGCVYTQYPTYCNSCVRRYGNYPDRYTDEGDYFIVDDRVLELAESWPDNLYRAVLGIEAKQYRRRPKHLEERIEKILEYLPAREQLVLRMRYETGCTLKETGDAIGVSVERARQIVNLGLRLHGALVRAGLFTVADIAKMDEKEILKIPGVGRKGAKELQEAIALH